MLAAALRHLASQDLDRLVCLAEEVSGALDEETVTVPLPCDPDSLVDESGLRGGLDPHGVLVVVTSGRGWCSKVDDRVVAPELLITARPDRLPEVSRAGPVGEAVDSAPVA